MKTSILIQVADNGGIICNEGFTPDVWGDPPVTSPKTTISAYTSPEDFLKALPEILQKHVKAAVPVIPQTEAADQPS